MPERHPLSNLTMTDLFCGAGGSSTGAVSVPGVSVRLAANHWDRAIETHNANHPDTDHLQADISQTDPRYIPTSDILWASPECTNHSRAKGKKLASQPDLFGEVLPDAAAERSRSTMWDVVRFAEVHNYKAILVENVVEVTEWASPHGIRGGLFQAWLTAMHSMGYKHRIVSMNSMHAQAYGLPAPQSRDRVYISFWKSGERAPDFDRMLRPLAWCEHCNKFVRAMQTFKKVGAIVGRYRSQYVYRCPSVSCRNAIVEPGWLPALSFLDLDNRGTRIGDRAKPLSEKTMRRVAHGITKFWHPLLVETANGYDAADPKHPGYMDPDSYWRAWSAMDPVRTLHTSESKALVLPPIQVGVEGRENNTVRTAWEVARTQTTRHEQAVVMPPIVTPYYGNSTPSTADEALSTITTHDRHGLVFPPFFAELYGTGKSRTTQQPVSTLTAGGNHHALVMRMNNNPGEDQSSMSTSVREPIRTITTKGHQALVGGGPTFDPNDAYFRMLEPIETKKGMGFPSDYYMVGTRREQVKLAGNAVTPPAARDLVATVVAAITGEDMAA